MYLETSCVQASSQCDNDGKQKCQWVLCCGVNSDWDVDSTCSYILVLLDIHDFQNTTVLVWEEKLTSHSNVPVLFAVGIETISRYIKAFMTITHVFVFKCIPLQTSAQVSNSGRHRRLCHLSSSFSSNCPWYETARAINAWHATSHDANS